NGADAFKKGLKNLEKEILRKAKALEGNVTLDELFTDDFMQRYSRYETMSSFFSACGISSAEEFQAFPDAKLDVFVKANSDFKSWEEMKSTAAAEYAKRKWPNL